MISTNSLYSRILPTGFQYGEVTEWSNVPVLKTGVPSRVPWVRIPPSPPCKENGNTVDLYNHAGGWDENRKGLKETRVSLKAPAGKACGKPEGCPQSREPAGE